MVPLNPEAHPPTNQPPLLQGGVEMHATQGRDSPERNLVSRFQSLALGVKFPLSEEELHHIFEQYQEVRIQYNQYKRSTLSEIQRKGKTACSVEQMIVLGSLALKKRFRIAPYDTQLLTLLALLSTPSQTAGRLAQVKTGEGKSTIIALLALVLSLKGKGVDIISSSHYLAKRDQKKYAPFFEEFGITTSHICDSQPQAECFEGQILYGMVCDFEFALMREALQSKENFSSLRKNFDCVIVDEVDNLLIDTSMNSARIAYPSKASNQWIYTPMFRFVQGIRREEGFVLENLKQYLSQYGPVKTLSDKQIKVYLSSAVTALHKEKNVDYVVHPSAEGEEKMVIHIIDKENTGRICEGLRWGEGLHEFLEVKHHLRPDLETVTPISLSHAVFYDHYRGQILGLSGTLGSREEREELNRIYGLEHFDAPVHDTFKRIDHPPEIFFTQREYEEALVSKIRTKQQQGRPVLILCPSIKESQELYVLCEECQIACQLFNEMQSENPETIIGNAGAPSQVTITTNNAGRGTDICLYPESEKAGGLHVILTFYSPSQRVEEQALGRGGRQGDNGSSETLLFSEKLKQQGIVIERSKDKMLDYLGLQDLATLLLVSNEYNKRVQAHPPFVLRDYREKSIRNQGSLHADRAQSERVLAQFSIRFWNTFKAWKQKVRAPSYFLETLSQDNRTPLSNALLHKTFSYLKAPEKRSIASVCKSWKVLVKESYKKEKWDFLHNVNHIESEAIHAWVKYFYRPAEKLIIDGDNLEMERLYEEQKHKWTQTLAPSQDLLNRAFDQL
jgi:preprotein translocase subunit SecA